MNAPTIIALSVVALLVIGIIVKSIINKKNGKSSCSCGCGSCANKDYCHPKKSKKENTKEN